MNGWLTARLESENKSDVNTAVPLERGEYSLRLQTG